MCLLRTWDSIVDVQCTCIHDVNRMKGQSLRGKEAHSWQGPSHFCLPRSVIEWGVWSGIACREGLLDLLCGGHCALSPSFLPSSPSSLPPIVKKKTSKACRSGARGCLRINYGLVTTATCGWIFFVQTIMLNSYTGISYLIFSNAVLMVPLFICTLLL